jgi:hypothetical protein
MFYRRWVEDGGECGVQDLDQLHHACSGTNKTGKDFNMYRIPPLTIDPVRYQVWWNGNVSTIRY